jgi:Dolichyl-phosphate-mannose-protein mannosyltransferase
LSIYWMVKYTQNNNNYTTKDWLLLGLFVGLATLSKVHGLYLWFGFGAYVLFHHVKTLQKRALYLAIVVTIICVFPILYWNIQNEFITYKFHSNRVTHTGILLDSFIQQIVGEIIYQNPLVYLTVFIALFNFKKLKLAFQNSGTVNAFPLLLWLSIPLLLTFWGLSLFNPTLPHWTGPAYISLFLLSGVYWSDYLQNKNSTQYLPNIIKSALGLLSVLILGVLLLIYQFPKQIGSTKNENLGEYNPINDLTGWESFTNSFSNIVQRDIANGTMPVHAPIVIHKWFPGGHILFYTARPLNMPVIAVGKLEDVHKFAWLNKQTTSLKIGDNAYYIVPSNLPVDPKILYSEYFEQISAPETIPMVTKGVLLRNFYVYKLMKCKKLPEATIK